MLKIILSALILTLSLSSNSLASSNVKGAEIFLKTVADKAVSAVSDSTKSKQEKASAVEKIMKENVDIKWIGRFVLGKHWRKANAQQKEKYLKYYEVFILNNYSSKFSDYSGQKYQINNSRKDDDSEYQVSTEIVNDNAANVLIDYRIKSQNGAYKIFDIIVEGVSMITTQRSEFNAVISRKGVDFLISALEKKAKKNI